MSALTLALLGDISELAEMHQSNSRADSPRLNNNNNSSNSNNSNNMNKIDSKAVGAHRSLSRRRSNPSSGDGSLFADSLTLLNNKLNQQSSLLQMAVNASFNEAKRGGGQGGQGGGGGGGGHRKLDRSQSEPVDPIRGGVIPANSSRYKTELCRPYEENGTCKYGDKCQFAHGMHELRSLVRHPKYKTELCRTFHTIGFCPYGPRCHFIHNEEEARIHNSNIDAMRNAAAAAAAKQRTNSKFSHQMQQQQTLPGGSTADSPSPPSSLSESPTSMNTFFADDLFNSTNPFSPSAGGGGANNAFLFGSDFVSPLFAAGRASSGGLSGPEFRSCCPLPELSQQYTSMGAYGRHHSNHHHHHRMNDLAELDNSPSPVDSLSSDLDSLSLSSASPPPPPPTSSGALRLPIFSRISETLNED